MNLSEKFDNACALVDNLLSEREKLVGEKVKADEVASLANMALTANDDAIRAAIRERDEARAALSIAPEELDTPDHMEELRANRQKVFAHMRQLPDVWVKPEAISIMSGVESEMVSAILRRAVKISGMPLEHNGERGRGSAYRWIGERKEG